MVRLRVLGLPEIEVDGRSFPLRQKTAELYGLLAVRRGPVSRTEVVATLWPDTPDGVGRHNLRQTLVALRNRQGDSGIRAEGDTLALEPEVTVDLWEREEAWAGTPEPERLLEFEPFLPSSGADWAVARRAEHERRAIELAVRLGEGALVDEPRRALAYAQAAASNDAEREAPRSLAVRARLALGDREGARREVESFEEAFQRSAGMAPPARLRALLEPPLTLDVAGLNLGLLAPAERLLLVLAAVPAVRHRPEVARAGLEAALAQAGGAARVDRARARVEIAQLTLAMGDVSAAEAHAQRALVEAEGETTVALAAAAVLVRVLSRTNRLDEALEEAMRVRETARTEGVPAIEVSALRALGTVLLLRHRIPEAEAQFREGLRIAERLADRAAVSVARYNLSFALLYRGRVAAAVEEMESALREAPPSEEGLIRMGMGRMREAEGRWAEARADYALAATRLRAGGDPFYLAQALTYQAELSLGRGEFEDAGLAYQEAVALRRTIGDRLGLMTAYKGLGVAAHRAGRQPEAIEYLRAALRFSLETGEPMEGANVRTALARVLEDAGRGEEALVEAKRARRSVRALRARASALTGDDTLSIEAIEALVERLENDVSA